MGFSNATPSDDGGKCTFVLGSPKIVQISGVNFVMATMNPGECTMHANPSSSVVCLAVEGDDTSGQCAQRTGPVTAVIYYSYRPGATYVVKGSGCANIITAPYTLCQDFPASRITL
jgi:hypothetical protein